MVVRQDAATLSVESVMPGRDGDEMKTTETWKLSDGGKLLSIESVRAGRDGGEMRTTAAYDKK